MLKGHSMRGNDRVYWRWIKTVNLEMKKKINKKRKWERIKKRWREGTWKKREKMTSNNQRK